MRDLFKVAQPREGPAKQNLTYQSSVIPKPSAPASQRPEMAQNTPSSKANWTDLLARTLDANCLVKSGCAHQSRKVNENVKVTMRTLMPELQPESDPKITGCAKKPNERVTSQTYKIG